MALLDVAKPYLPKQLPISVVLTLSPSRAPNFSPCGLVRVRLMFGMSSIREELLLLVFCSLINWILLLCLEVDRMEMPEVQEIELSTSYSRKWTVLERKRIFSLLEQQIGLKFWMKHFFGQYLFILFLGTS
jgi:hypothetical protein